MTVRALLPAAGFLVWASAFATLYAMLSVGCRFGWDHTIIAGDLSLQRMQLIVALLLHVLALVLLAAWLKRRACQGFIEQVSLGLAVAALIATVFNFGWVFVLSTCD